jgi:hypothetical protein
MLFHLEARDPVEQSIGFLGLGLAPCTVIGGQLGEPLLRLA